MSGEQRVSYIGRASRSWKGLTAAIVAGLLLGIIVIIYIFWPILFPPTVIIVSDLPFEGPSRRQSQTIENAITLALKERGYMAGDVRIEYKSWDDATPEERGMDEDKCGDNARSAAQDKSIVGWIGPFNSGCAKLQIPILNQAGIAMVSPSNTYIGLTKPSGEPGEPGSYYPTGNRDNYNRVVTTDDSQGRAGAIWMSDRGVQSVYILDDQETYGAGLAEQFEQAANKLGIQVLGREGIDGDDDNYRALMTQIADLQPDAIYFGGITENNAGQLVKDKLDAEMSNEDVIFMGADGIREEAFLDDAGSAAEDIYVTCPCLVPSLLPEPKGQDFIQRYEYWFPDPPIEAYTAYGYESANVLLDAIERDFDADWEVTREGVVGELRATWNYDGVLGNWSFDPDGDTDLPWLSIQRVEELSFDDFDLNEATAIDVSEERVQAPG